MGEPIMVKQLLTGNFPFSNGPLFAPFVDVDE